MDRIELDGVWQFRFLPWIVPFHSTERLREETVTGEESSFPAGKFAPLNLILNWIRENQSI
jgi:hypothetical protein